jgi:hypothetical protein
MLTRQNFNVKRRMVQVRAYSRLGLLPSNTRLNPSGGSFAGIEDSPRGFKRFGINVRRGNWKGS